MSITNVSGAMVEVRLSASKALRAQVGDPRFSTTEEDVPKGIITLPGYPRKGDWISWPDSGQQLQVIDFLWNVSDPIPTAIVGDMR